MQRDPSCIFCRIIDGEAEASVVYKDDVVTAFMDIRPLTPGHLLIVPNRHAVDLAVLDDTFGSHMFVVGRQLAQALRGSGLRCEGVNLFLADGAVAGQTVFHCHLHVLPRFTGDGFSISFPPGYGNGGARELLDAHASKVRAALEANRDKA